MCGSGRQWNPPLDPEIMITHTNWATQEIHWDPTNQIILLKKLPAPSAVRPWMTFDGNGVILEDGGARRYLASTPLDPFWPPGPIYFGAYKENQHRAAYIPNGALAVINVN